MAPAERKVLFCKVHTGKLTWNLKRALLKRIVVYREHLFRFHVCFPQCKMAEVDPKKRKSELLLSGTEDGAVSIYPDGESSLCREQMKGTTDGEQGKQDRRIPGSLACS